MVGCLRSGCDAGDRRERADRGPRLDGRIATEQMAALDQEQAAQGRRAALPAEGPARLAADAERAKPVTAAGRRSEAAREKIDTQERKTVESVHTKQLATVTALIDCAHARGAHFVQHVFATLIGEQLDFEGWTLSRLHEFVLQIVLALPDHLERIAEASRVELA
jgi:hypothetical protein